MSNERIAIDDDFGPFPGLSALRFRKPVEEMINPTRMYSKVVHYTLSLGKRNSLLQKASVVVGELDDLATDWSMRRRMARFVLVKASIDGPQPRSFRVCLDHSFLCESSLIYFMMRSKADCGTSGFYMVVHIHQVGTDGLPRFSGPRHHGTSTERTNVRIVKLPTL